jgi:DNA-binding LacI/PurR family transcriptional regulator
MKSLAEIGMIESIKGSGTYIRDHALVEKNDSDNKIISVILISEETPFTNRLCAVLQNFGATRNMKMEWHFVHSISKLYENKAMLDDLRGEAVIIPWFRETDEEMDSLGSLESELGIPVISNANRGNADLSCFRAPERVGRDSMRASHLSCEYFVKMGCEALVLVGNANEAHDSMEFQHRLNGFQEYCLDNDMPNLVCLYEVERPDLKMLYRFIEKYRSKLGVICFHDDLAAKVMGHLQDKNYHIPNDVGIIGFNNQSFCSDLRPSLTSISMDFDSLAAAMLDHAIARMSGESQQLKDQLPMAFHVRESCGGELRLENDVLTELVKNLS